MFNITTLLPDGRWRCLYWQLRALLALLPWRLHGPMAREPQRCRPGATHFLAHALLAVLSTGCASLPAEAPRQYSETLGSVAATRLAGVVRASATGEDVALSGFRLLSDGDHALDARVALARRAEVALDIQYYILAADDAGRRFVRELRDAAARGVRVRLLVDDLVTQDSRDLLADLAAHPGVEVRLFNPLPARDGSAVARVLLSLHQLERINRRMHNKLLIADASLAILGGRNIADDYFERGEASGFIDMDVIASGPVVRDLSTLFDRFWNSPQAWPIAALEGATGDAGRAAQRFADATRAPDADPPVAPFDRFGRPPVSEQLDAGRLDQHFAPARLLADGPEKASVEHAPPPESSALQGALTALQAANTEVLVATPYLVPGPRGLAMLEQALAKKVRVVMMTNALAATDEPLVHSGYARYRAGMLRMGAELHELSPALGRRAVARGEASSSLGRLHAKVAVIDRQRLLIGSMNMDMRSLRANTELGLLIDSEPLAQEVARVLQRDLETRSWRLRVAASPAAIEWVATEAEGEVVHRAEPDVGLALQLRLGLMSMFVAEEML